MNREDTANLTPQPYQLDQEGRPVIEHRPLMHDHMPGGGVWVIKSAIVKNFLPFVTGKPYAHHYDSYTAVSGATILMSKMLLPRHQGSTEPMQHDFMQPLDDFVTQAREKVFPPKPVKSFDFLPDWLGGKRFLSYQRSADNFFTHRGLSDLRLAFVSVGNNLNVRAHKAYARTLQSVTDIVDPLRVPEETHRSKFARYARAGLRSAFTLEAFKGLQPVLPMLPSIDLPYLYHIAEGVRQRQLAAANALQDRTTAKLDTLGRLKAKDVHMDARALYEQLKANLRVDIPGHHPQSKPARMADAVAPYLAPTINMTAAVGNEWVRHVRAPFFGATKKIRPRLRSSYREEGTMAAASLYSCLLPAVYTTQQNPVDGHQYSDGGSVYSPARGTKDMMALYAPHQKFVTTTYECNMSHRPPRVNPDDLNRGHILGTVNNAFSLNVRVARRGDDLDLEGDPRCLGRLEFGRPALFDAPPLAAGSRVRASMERYAQYVTKGTMGLDECMNANIPALDTSSQIDPSPEKDRIYRAAGVQAIVRHLPELVGHIKDLVVRGPLSDRMTSDQQGELLLHIDTNFPPRELAEIKARRQYDSGIDPDLVGNYHDADEQETAKHLIELRIKGKQAAQTALPVQEFGMAK